MVGTRYGLMACAHNWTNRWRGPTIGLTCILQHNANKCVSVLMCICICTYIHVNMYLFTVGYLLCGRPCGNDARIGSQCRERTHKYTPNIYTNT